LIRNGDRNGVTETLRTPAKPPEAPDPRECSAQIERLIANPLLQRSETLCRLLLYLADHTLNSPANHLKEHQIATEALGRSPDFDPQLDASVRVQAGRLRSKLAEYYASAGVHDPIIVDVPKGSYTLSFERRVVAAEPRSPAAEPAPPAANPGPVLSGPVASSSIRQGAVFALAALAVLTLAGGLLLYMVGRRIVQPAAAKAVDDRLPAAFRTFWTPFLHGPDEPIVVFSNAIFVGNGETGLRYFKPSRDSRDQIIQHYTGVGELVGVLELDRVFEKAGGEFRIKRGGLFTFDEARNNNLIFVGSPMENLTLRQIPTTQQFVFRSVPEPDNRSGEVIVDLHPRPGESGVYPPPAKPGAEDADFAIVALLPGFEHSRWTLILAGRSTISTQAAVDFVCNQSSLEDLLHRANIANGAEMRPFEALLRVKAVNDVPLETQIVDLRRTNP
jgi:hypothetical protein